MATWIRCCKCKTDFAMADELETAARASENIYFYCPYGHSQHYPASETAEIKLRRERDLLQQRIAQKDDEIAHQRKLRESAERSASAMRGQVTRIKNRVGRGVCPCCNRSFNNLSRHIHSKHPDYATDNVVEFKAS